MPSLTDQQKKILLIASFAFSLLSACYIFSQICFKVKPLNYGGGDDEINNGDEEINNMDENEKLTSNSQISLASQLIDDYYQKTLSISLEDKLTMAKQAGEFLTALNLEATSVTNEQLREVLQLCPNLQKINLFECHCLTDEIIKGLQNLSLYHCEKLTEACFKILPKDLQTLKVTNKLMTNGGVKDLPKGLQMFQVVHKV